LDIGTVSLQFAEGARKTLKVGKDVDLTKVGLRRDSARE